MSKANEALKLAAEEAIREYTGDTSVPAETTRDGLEDLKASIQVSIDAINDDLKRDET